MRKIVVAGTILVDKICFVDAYPRAGELTQIRSIERVSGGLVPNVACDLRILSPDVPVAAFGMTGDDDDGRFVRKILESHGVDTSGVAVSADGSTSFTDVMSIPGGERTFFTFSGASAHWGYEDFPFDKVEEGDIVLLGYFLLLDKIDSGDGLCILRELKKRGAKTAIDLVTENSNRYGIVKECLSEVDYLIINEIEAARIAGIEDVSDFRSVASTLLEAGVRERVVIHHPRGAVSLARSAGGPVWTECAAIDVPPEFIKGKTGAGDAFCAGALIGIYNSLSESEILELGSLAAVGALSAPGATEGMRSIVELKEMKDSICNE